MSEGNEARFKVKVIEIGKCGRLRITKEKGRRKEMEKNRCMRNES